MALRSLSLLFVISVAFSFIPFSRPTPFILLHGLNNNCSRDGVPEMVEKLTNLSGVEGQCIEVGNGIPDSWFMPMHKQVDIVCQKVIKIHGPLCNGNMIARRVIEFCDGGPPVKNYLSLAGPQAGVASIPECSSSDVCILVANQIKLAVYNDFVQDSLMFTVHTSIIDKPSSNLQEHLAPSNYLKIPDAIQDHLENSSFLPCLNNEYPDSKNSTYKERLSSLENLVLIMFENDTVLIPKETSRFGYYPDGSFGPVLSPKQTKLYTEDWIGLRSMDEGGKVKFISVGGDHLQISDTDLQTYVVPYLKGQNSTKSGNSIKLGS